MSAALGIELVPAADLTPFAPLRAEVRAFLAEAMPPPTGHAYLGGWNADFSRAIGARGWIGMCWPKAYGGGERSLLERYVVAEEMLAARAPMAAHWIGDRQAGPLLLRYGSEAQRRAILPRIAAGECGICIGMSEPGSGSDLASVTTRAEPIDGRFRLTGSKLWTSGADRSTYMMALCRTAPRGEERHAGLSQFLVDLTLPGITIRPIVDMVGEPDFCEVFFDDVMLPPEALVGTLGDGWRQVTSELAFERAGPERYLSSFALLTMLVDALGDDESERAHVAIGRLTAHVAVARQLSISVATMQAAGDTASVQAALVKDIGTSLEQEIVEVARSLASIEPDRHHGTAMQRALAEMLLRAPAFSIRGGTREVLRGIIAKGIGL